VALDVAAVLELSRELQQAVSLRDLLVATRASVRAATPYRTVWLAAFRHGPPSMVDILAIAGEEVTESLVLSQAATFPVAGDRMLEQIYAATEPVVVADARTDPRTDKAMVERLGNRTIVNVPLLIGEERLGALGIGTYAPEPPLPPTPEQLELLVVFATQVAAAFQRVQMLEEQRKLQRRLQAVRRLESVALLAGGVAHDFNNLLTGILNGLAFVAEGPLTPAQREDLDVASEAARRAAELTRHLLAVGRRQSLRLVPVDLVAQLRGVQRLVRRLLPERVELAVDTPEVLPVVMGDPGGLDQILVNLCTNARDAMPGGGKLTLSAAVVEPGAAPEGAHVRRDAPYVCISATDTGSGMTPEVLERVFEPFFTTKEQGRGTGIGLAAAAGIAEQHGGSLECTSVPGYGTTFRLYLPTCRGPVPAEATVPEAPVERGRERVLVAEDDPRVRQAVARTLRDGGYDVVVVEDGVAAIERAQAEAFDLVLLDAIMPRADGRVAWERIRAARPEARFLLMSGHAAEVFPPDVRAAAGVPLLAKPFLPGDLLRAVREALDRPPRPVTA